MEEVSRRFKLIYRDGRRLSISYALLPLIKLESDHRLKITMGGFKITINGRGMSIAEEYLSNERITWFKEHPSMIDDPEQDIYISDIIVGDEE